MALLLALGFSGCAHSPALQPAPDATTVPAEKGAAQASVAGVQIVVNQHSWTGSPSDLESVVTPLDVSISNASAEPVRVMYRDFALENDQGLNAVALPPFKIQRPGGSTEPVAPFYPLLGFDLYSPYASFYPGYSIWEGPFVGDPAFNQDFGSWEPSLPSHDMLQRALPEGVLRPGGQARGFLYFHRLQDRGPVSFQAHLVDAHTGQDLGTVRIPLVYR